MKDQGQDALQNFATYVQSQATERMTMNVKHVLMVVTEDKVRLCLKRRLEAHDSDLAKTTAANQAKQAWLVPFGFLVTIVLAFTTATFVDAFGIHKETWTAVFLMFGFGMLCWLLYSLVQAIKAIRASPFTDIEVTIDRIVAELQQATKDTTTYVDNAPPTRAVRVIPATAKPTSMAEEEAAAEEEAVEERRDRK